MLINVSHLKKLHLHILLNFCFKLADYVYVLCRYALRNIKIKELLPKEEQQDTCVPKFFLGCNKVLIVWSILSIYVILVVNMS